MAINLKNIPVDEYTTPSPIAVTTDDGFGRIRELMEANGIRHIIVLKNNEPMGIISERDLLFAEKFASKDLPLTAEDMMTENPFCVSAETSLEEVVFELSSRKIGSAIVKYDDGSTGIFTTTDALNALIEIIRGQA
ncbi:MAG: CBS domain-containing protein [Bdellovibrionales bacterium]|nr:CBS domain-containing protein [Bdellovibrionales bacterium]